MASRHEPPGRSREATTAAKAASTEARDVRSRGNARPSTSAATDTAQSNKLYNEAERMLATDVPAIPLWTSSTAYGWSDKVANVKLTPFGTIDLTSISVK